MNKNVKKRRRLIYVCLSCIKEKEATNTKARLTAVAVKLRFLKSRHQGPKNAAAGS